MILYRICADIQPLELVGSKENQCGYLLGHQRVGLIYIR